MDLNFNDFLTEEEIIKIMEIKKEQLKKLRYNQEMPYIRVTKNLRMYYVPDVLNWLNNMRRRIPSSH